MIYNISETNLTNLNVSHRQPKLFFGPLLGFFLANILSNSAFAKLAPLGSIRLEYDPLPFLNLNFPRPLTTTPSPQPATQKPELVEIISHPQQDHSTTNEYLIHDSNGNNYYLESPPDQPLIYKKPENTKEGIRDLTAEASNIDQADIGNIQDNIFNKFEDEANSKNHVKRQIYRYPYSKYFNRGNRYAQYLQRRRLSPADYFEDDSYEDLTRRYYRPSNRRRYQNGRRPVNFEDEYEDYFNDFDYDIKPIRKPERKNRNKFKTRNKQESADEDNSEFDDDVESVTQVIKPKQRQTTTTTTQPETTIMTNITTGVTPPSNNTTGYYGYGPSNGNENISITYAPPTAQKPVYGPPSTGYGAPEYTPSSLYGFSGPTLAGYPGLSYGTPSISYSGFTPIQSYNTLGGTYGTPSTSYGTPSTSYGSPSISYGSPSLSYATPSATYGKPSSSYGTPSNTYGSPSNTYGAPSNTYGAPSNTYGTPGKSYGTPSSSYGSPPSTSYGSPGSTYETPGYQSYQLPYSSWYKKGSSRIEMARRAQDILSYDGLYKDNFKK